MNISISEYRKMIKKKAGKKISSLEKIVQAEFRLSPDIVIISTQPAFEIVPGFTRNKRKYQSIKYTADFHIKECGKDIIVEVKSTGVLRANKKSYPMRRKLFLRFLTDNFPEFIFREIIFDDRKNRTVKEY